MPTTRLYNPESYAAVDVDAGDIAQWKLRGYRTEAEILSIPLPGGGTAKFQNSGALPETRDTLDEVSALAAAGGIGAVTDAAVAGIVGSGTSTRNALNASWDPVLTAASTATSSGALAVDKHTPLDATSGALTMTLPTPTRIGQRIRVEKLDATTNTVTISGTLRGAAGTVVMPFQYEVREFFAESLSSWRVASGNTPKAALDGYFLTQTAAAAAYQQVWKPNTAYASGAIVVSPAGQLVQAKATFTSGATYNDANWTILSAGGLTQALADVLYERSGRADRAGLGHWATSPAQARVTARATQLTTPTPDGSGVVVHPSVVYAPSGFAGRRYWMALTPYFNNDSTYENPCVYYSDDGNTWTAIPGNPVEAKPAAAGAYNSDTHLLIVNGVMYLFWRVALDNSATGERLRYRTSTDGLTWTAMTETGVNSNPSTRSYVSPAVSYIDGTWVMYVVDSKPSPRVIRRLTATSPSGPWGNDTAVTLTSTTGATLSPWHIDAHLVGDEWHMLIQDGGPGGGDLYAAVATLDGTIFTAGPAIISRFIGWDLVYYRSCFLPAVVNGEFGWDLWLGGFGNPHSIGRTRLAFDRDAYAARQATAAVSDQIASHGTLPPWLAGDAFARPNASTLGTSPSGHAWSTSTFGIVDKAAQPTAGAFATIDVGTGEHWASVTFNGTGEQWLNVRVQDSSNRFRIGTDGNTTNGTLVQKVSGGSVVSLPGIASIGPAGKTLAVRCLGSTLSIYLDGELIMSITDSDFATATKVGMQGAPTARFRNFRVRTA